MRATAAAFDAAYAAIPVRGTPAALDATVTTEPRPRSASRAPTARQACMTPVALTSRQCRQSASSSSVTRPTCSTPATLTSVSSGPSASSAASTAFSTAAASVTSAGTATARAAVLAHGRGGRLDGLGVAVEQRDRRARVGEAPADREPDAAGGARHQGRHDVTTPGSPHRCPTVAGSPLSWATGRSGSGRRWPSTESRISPARTAVVESSVELIPWVCSVGPCR